VRSVLTLSDLGGAIIEGADFSDAVIDLPQKQVHNKYLNSSIIARMTLFFVNTQKVCMSNFIEERTANVSRGAIG
jgi:hypothetical protein